MPRVLTLGLFAAIAAVLLPQSAVAHDSICSGTMRIIVPFGAGTSIDVAARAVATSIEKSMNQPAIVVNKPGASGQIASRELTESSPDGCTIGVMATAPLNLRGIKALRTNASYDIMSEFVAIGRLYAPPFLLAINGKRTGRTFDEFVAFARTHPGSVNIGTSYPLADAVVSQLSEHIGSSITHVQYRGADVNSLGDLIEDRIQGSVVTPGVVTEHFTNGTLSPLFVVARSRLAQLPHTPTAREIGIRGIERMESWVGLVGPHGLKPAIVSRLNAALSKALSEPTVKQTFERIGVEPDSSTPDEMEAVIRQQLAVWLDLEQKGVLKVD
jgi:tripartite-type tricarboxylate transporter receptor subunit TctC